MSIIPTRDVFDASGIHGYIRNERIKTTYCHTLRYYNLYSTDSSDAVFSSQSWLIGGYTNSSGLNALGLNPTYCGWGSKDTALGFFQEWSSTSPISLVPTYYGLLPTKTSSGTHSNPFYGRKFISTIYLKYQAGSSPAIYYSTDNSNWSFLINGTGIFFIMTGAGGGGASGSNNWAAFGGGAGGGGGSGASVFAYLDVYGAMVKYNAMEDLTFKFTPGAAGGGATAEGSDGSDGGASTLTVTYTNDMTSIIKTATVLTCAGGKGGKCSEGDGGDYGETPTDPNLSYLKCYNLYHGKQGGSYNSSGVAFSSTTRLTFPILKDDYVPYENNGTYGEFHPATSDGAWEHGGGGGASLLQSGTWDYYSDYGAGGAGGWTDGKNSGDDWGAGVDGGTGAILICSVSST